MINMVMKELHFFDNVRHSMKVGKPTPPWRSNQHSPLDSHLYSKIQKILQQQSSSEMMKGEEDVRMRLAISIFKDALERYKQQLSILRQRIQDSSITFEATIELPCAHHPQGAVAFHEMEATTRSPYLELEQAELDFSIRTTNRRQNNTEADDDDDDANEQTQQTPQQPQRHIYTATFGASTQWDGTGKSGAEVTLGADYQLSPTSKTTWTTEMTTPVTHMSEERRPVKMQFSSTHEFVSGTVMNAGIRGSNISLKNWEYFLTSFRKLSVPWLEEPDPENADKKNMITTNLRGTMAMGMKMFTAQPLFGFVSLTTIPPPKQDHHHDSYFEEPEQDGPQRTSKTDSPTFSSSFTYLTNRILHTAKSIWWTTTKTPWSLSTPELSLRAGYHPSPILASIKYSEFGKPWASVFASWAWSLSQDCSKIKVLLSTDMWGLFRDNDTTTLRTGLKHDMYSGWIWLWEWEELDWTLKVPISLSMTKNNRWMAAAAMGTTQAAAIMGEANNDNLWHNSLGTLLASCIVLKVARSMVSDWTGRVHDGNRQRKSKRQKRNSDPMMSQEYQDSSFRLDGADDDNDDDVVTEGSPGSSASLRKQMAKFKTLMTNIAAKKRATELHKNGLVIRFAKLTEPSSKMNASPSLVVERAMMANAVRVRDLTDTLQFWTSQSKLDLPPLSSQAAPYDYMMGGASTTVDSSSRSKSSTLSATVASALFPLSLLSNVNGFDKIWKPQQLQPVMDCLLPHVRHVSSSTASSTLSDSKRRTPMVSTKQPNSSLFLVIRYQFELNVYELTVDEDDPIVLPSPDALLLGSADSIQ